MRNVLRKIVLASLVSTTVGCLFSPAAQFTSDFNGGLPPGSALAGNAAVATAGGLGNSGVLKLTLNAAGQQGAYYVSDFAGGNAVTNFLVVARAAIGGGTARPADGMAFAFGTDVGAPPGTFGEEGVGTGINVTLDTWDNNGDDTAPAIDVRYGGAILAFQSMATNNGSQSFREGARDAAGPVLRDGSGQPVNLQTFGPGAAPTDASFVNLVIQLFPDNTLSVSWSNVMVFNHLPIPYTPISGGTFAFGGRTGGATEDHWIDNLTIFANFIPGPATIVTQPTNQSVVESQRATFSVQVAGTPPFTAQWFSNNVAISGADQLTYTTPPATTNMNGAIYRVEVRNSQNATAIVSANATLTVISGLVLQSASSRNTATNVFVVFNKPATRVGTYSLSPAAVIQAIKPGPNPNEVLLETAPLTLEANYTLTVTGERGTDNSTLLPNPSTARFHYGFGAFCRDFNDNLLPPRSVLGGGATISGGSIHLTEAAQLGACGSFWVPDQVAGSPLDRLQARWSSLVGNGGGGGADGYSFNWAADLPSPAGGCYGSEEGAGSGLSVTVDTFDNGAPDIVGIEIKWRGTRVASAAVPKDNPGNGVFLRKARFVDASVEVLPNGTATVNYDGTVITAALPGFTSVSGGNFLFVGRTGGASDDQWLDNVRINCFTLGPPVFTRQPVTTRVIEGDTATFTATADGAPPLALQWLTNGVPVPGAITGSYTTPPGTPSLDGLQVSVRAGNEFGTTTSSNAIFHVVPAPRVVRCFMSCEPNILHVVWTKPVQLDGSYAVDVSVVNGVTYGSSHSEVLVDIDALPPQTTATVTIQDVHDQGRNVQFPNPATCTVIYGYKPFCTDFNTGLPAGTAPMGVAAVRADGILHLTDDGMNGACGSFFIPDPSGGVPLDRLQVRWRSLIGGVDQAGEAQQFGTGGADGYSLSWGSDVANACAGGPEGTGTGLSVTVDTFDNGGGEAPGIEMKWRGVRVAFSPVVPGDQAAAKAFLRKGQFVDAEVVVSPTGDASFTYDGITIRGTLPNFAPITNGKFLFAASTGGAQDNHWVDNLCINGFSLSPPVIVSSPASQTVPEGTTGTFSVAVNGLPPFGYQWLRNGMPIPGATNSSYSTIATSADNASTYAVTVVNECGGPVTSKVATITVLPKVVKCFMLCEANVIHVLYSRPVGLDGTYAVDVAMVKNVSYGSSQSEVLVGIDPLALGTTATLTIRGVHDQSSPPNLIFPNPTTCKVHYGFGAFCTDFNTNRAPAGTALGGGATIGGTAGTDGILHLTDAHANGACGAFFIADRSGGAPLDRLQAKWKSRVGGGDAGADGYSFNWGADVPGAGQCAGSEEGAGTGLSVTVDTFDNGSDIPGVDVVGIEIRWKGQRVASQAIPKDNDGSGNFLRKDQFVDASVVVTPDGMATFTYDGNAISAALPGYAPITGGNFMFVARTGGANDNQWVDDLCINQGPLFTCPNIVAEYKDDLTTVSYNPRAQDICGGSPVVTCTPPSGTGFHFGTSTVVCTATDGLGYRSSCTFSVTVASRQSCLNDLLVLRGGITNKHDLEELDDAVGHLVDSFDPARWVDATHLERKHGDKVFEEHKKAVHELVELLKDKKSTVSDSELLRIIDCILQMDRKLATAAIDAAAAAGVNEKKIAEARKKLAKGDEDAGDGDFEQAIDGYRDAWKQASHAKIQGIHPMANGAVQLEILGSAGDSYIIQASTNLIDWVTLDTQTAGPDGSLNYEELHPPSGPVRFYRILTP